MHLQNEHYDFYTYRNVVTKAKPGVSTTENKMAQPTAYQMAARSDDSAQLSTQLTPSPSNVPVSAPSPSNTPQQQNFQKFTLDWDDLDDKDDDESEKTNLERKRMFSKELRLTLYGYGDDQSPYTETVDFLEDLVLEFITSMTCRAMEIGRPGRVQVEDIIFLVRKEPRMYARVRELLTMNEELKKARKAFDEIKYV